MPSESLLVSQFVCHSEGQREPGVFTNAAAAMWLTHPCHMGQTESLTGHIDGRADVLPVKNRVSQTYSLWVCYKKQHITDLKKGEEVKQRHLEQHQTVFQVM